MNILAEIVEKTKERMRIQEEKIPFTEIRNIAENIRTNTVFAFEKALQQQEIAFICEVKKASPSKGVFSPNFPYLEIAKDYEKAGAAAISCLTEPFYFQGHDNYLQEIAKVVSIPVLRKDFIINEYMLYEAKALGASAVLLICSILEKEQLKEYIGLCDSLKLSALVEVHTKEEIEKALYANARILGVNNRNLKTFNVDIQTSIDLRAFVPESCIFVSESGIKTRDDIALLKNHKVNAVLVGETLMLAQDKTQALQSLRI